jgi:protein O-mannosyl-transferase
MSKKTKIKIQKTKPGKPASSLSSIARVSEKNKWQFALAALLTTAICFSPMLKNGLTNWDDEFYVVQNTLLRGPDWQGIFTKPVVSNYHPLTIITLALNYQFSQLDPTSYLVVNYLLHLVNTLFVFLLVLKLSNFNTGVAFFTSLVFGIHPMHVESVAWVSERKDVLYTFFFLVGLLQYWEYLETGKKKNYGLCLLFFVLSILSKPAAIVFPLVLFLLDYWKGREIRLNLAREKFVFFLISVVFTIITLQLQSKTAMASLDLFPIWSRFFFACYGIMIYLLRFFIPYPLSAFHPFPSPDHLGWDVWVSPFFVLALLISVWYFRKNKVVIFSFFFFIINLLLVLQVISVGATLISERYTYMPYIGLAFLTGMIIEKNKMKTAGVWKWSVTTVVVISFGLMTFQRTRVWKNSETLWSDVINHYPEAPVPRTNRANNAIRMAADPVNKSRKEQLYNQALVDCAEAIKYKPNHAKAYENRQNIYLVQGKDSLALSDANMLIRLEPGNRLGYYTKGVVLVRLNQPDSALVNFDKCLELNPKTDYALNNRGSLLFNHFGKYDEAISDFTKAISINPAGNYFLNRSKCFYKKGEMQKAKSDLQEAIRRGEHAEETYKQLLNLQ